MALQCGGRHFSGVSANPLVGWVSKEVVSNGGAANLAETDELIGPSATCWQTSGTRRRRGASCGRSSGSRSASGWHGHTAEDNPSGGNNYRGLYNISIKSIGAARRRRP